MSPDGLVEEQVALLRRRLEADPQAFRETFIAGRHERRRLGVLASRTSARTSPRRCGNCCCATTTASMVLMRFLWAMPLKPKRKFIRAIDDHLSDRYPMFEGLSEGWPAGTRSRRTSASREEREHDFGLVNKGYLGYLTLGSPEREVDLFVWLEALRDKQCDDSPASWASLIPGRAEPKGGCPVKIHIPEMIDLLGKGKFREAMELIECCNPLPERHRPGLPAGAAVPGRVHRTPRGRSRSASSSGSCPSARSWSTRQRRPSGSRRPSTPGQSAEKPPIAVVGSGPSGLINAYLLAAEGFPVTVFEAFHELGGVLRYGIPEFRLPNELIDDVVGKINLLGGRFVPNFVVGKTATLEDLKETGFWKIFVGTGAGLPRFMNVPGEHYLGIMSANEFLTRVNLMRALDAKIRDAAARRERQGGARHRRRQHGDGRRPHRPPARRQRHHRLPPHQGGDAGPRRGASSRARGRHQSEGRCARPIEFIGDETTDFISHDGARRQRARRARRLGPPQPEAHRRDRDDAGRPHHHGARQHLEPDHQGRRARPAQSPSGAPSSSATRVAGDLDPGRLLRRRRGPWRLDRHHGGGRRPGRGAGDRRRRRRSRRPRSRSWCARRGRYTELGQAEQTDPRQAHARRRHRGVQRALAVIAARRPRPASSSACLPGRTAS